jgi:DNA-binding winged helix-turn-helix (wHTH) protein/tetratricopeptide (TPR) repeat protein
MNRQDNHICEFGHWRVDAAQRLLFHEGEHVPLQPKAFEILLALVERRGELVSKEELMERVWPDAFVEEINLTKNISVLRKTLANGNGHGRQEYIVTIPKRGYRFVAEIGQPQPDARPADTASSETTIRSHQLPAGAEVSDESNRRGWNRRLLIAAVLVMGIALTALLYFRSGSEREREAAQRLSARGRGFWNQRTIESMRKGLTCFEQAVELDPNYAPAWAGIADCWSLLCEYDAVTAHEAYPKAKAATLRALELDERLAGAHTALALIKSYYDWDWAGAEESFCRALELKPDHATTHQWYAEFLAARGRFPDALREIHRAQELDPGSLIIQSVEAWILYFARDYDGAIAQCRRVIGRDSSFAEIYSYLGRSCELKGLFHEAMEAYEKRSSMMGDNTQRASALRTAPIQNAGDFWRRRLEVEEVKLNGTSFEAAEALAQLGETERALALLEQACDRRATVVPYLNVWPNLDPLRAHPRFQALLRRARLVSE